MPAQDRIMSGLMTHAVQVQKAQCGQGTCNCHIYRFSFPFPALSHLWGGRGRRICLSTSDPSNDMLSQYILLHFILLMHSFHCTNTKILQSLKVGLLFVFCQFYLSFCHQSLTVQQGVSDLHFSPQKINTWYYTPPQGAYKPDPKYFLPSSSIFETSQ